MLSTCNVLGQISESMGKIPAVVGPRAEAGTCAGSRCCGERGRTWDPRGGPAVKVWAASEPWPVVEMEAAGGVLGPRVKAGSTGSGLGTWRRGSPRTDPGSAWEEQVWGGKIPFGTRLRCPLGIKWGPGGQGIGEPGVLRGCGQRPKGRHRHKPDAHSQRGGRRRGQRPEPRALRQSRSPPRRGDGRERPVGGRREPRRARLQSRGGGSVRRAGRRTPDVAA